MLISATISTLPLWRRRYTKGTFLELPAFVEVTEGRGTRGRELRQNDYREPDDCCSWTHKSCGNLTILRSLRGREDRHGYRYTHIYVLHIYCMCKLLHSNAAILLTPCGSAGRGKPKTKSKQRTSKTERRTGETDKLEVESRRGGHYPPSRPSAVATAFATWLLHFTQFGASSENFLQSVLALTDVIKKPGKGRREEEGVHPFSLSLSLMRSWVQWEAGAPAI